MISTPPSDGLLIGHEKMLGTLYVMLVLIWIRDPYISTMDIHLREHIYSLITTGITTPDQFSC